jgi:hypothetical protein
MIITQAKNKSTLNCNILFQKIMSRGDIPYFFPAFRYAGDTITYYLKKLLPDVRFFDFSLFLTMPSNIIS